MNSHPTVTALVCKYKDPRCTDHATVQCRGPHGVIKCSCAVTEEIKEAVKAANKAEYNREKARMTTTKESMKRKCYDIEVGDTIRIEDHVEGTIEAEVTGCDSKMGRFRLGFPRGVSFPPYHFVHLRSQLLWVSLEFRLGR